MSETVVLLHGFSGTHRAWDRVIAQLDPQRYRPLALDLRGHGAAGGRRPISFATCVEDVLAAGPERFALAGYSMGARVALHIALTAPERVSRLVLVSASAGIEDPAQRERRRQADRALAERIETEGVAAFAREWAAQALFAGQGADVSAEAHADRLRNGSSGLAAALRGIGTGAMEPLWGRLLELGMPVALLAGERDSKFVALGARLARLLALGRAYVVPAAGHAAHLEAPAAVAAALESTLPPAAGAHGRLSSPPSGARGAARGT